VIGPTFMMMLGGVVCNSAVASLVGEDQDESLIRVRRDEYVP
jgi:hypothetical protein